MTGTKQQAPPARARTPQVPGRRLPTANCPRRRRREPRPAGESENERDRPVDHIASAAMAARCGRESRGVNGGEYQLEPEGYPAGAAWPMRRGSARDGGPGHRGPAAVASRRSATHQAPKPMALANDGRSSPGPQPVRKATMVPAWSGRPPGFLACPRDKRSRRQGAPSTMSAGPAIERRQNWTDSTNKYRRASVSTGGTMATAIRASPAGASPASAGRATARQRGGFRMPRSSPRSASTGRTLVRPTVLRPAPGLRRRPGDADYHQCCDIGDMGETRGSHHARGGWQKIAIVCVTEP